MNATANIAWNEKVPHVIGIRVTTRKDRARVELTLGHEASTRVYEIPEGGVLTVFEGL